MKGKVIFGTVIGAVIGAGLLGILGLLIKKIFDDRRDFRIATYKNTV